MKTDIENKRCFICGKNGADSDDHIPPKNLFLKKYRSMGHDLIAVPAHSTCNKSFEKDDEYFRYCLLIPAYWTSELARELWDRKLRKQIHRKESANFRKYILKNLTPVEIKTPSGLFLGTQEAAMLDSKRMDGVVERIARGIYYSINKNILPIDFPVDVQMLEPIEGKKQLIKLNVTNKLVSIGIKIFQYYWQPANNDISKGLFWFIFFESVYYWVFII